MRRARKGLAIAALLLSSCAQFEVRDKLSSPSHEQGQPCDFKYSLDITSREVFEHIGVRKTESNKLQRLRGKYSESTIMVLKKNGCTATYVTGEEEATFKVRVERSISRSMTPQGWLTGLSFGLIPSWGTLPRQYTYTFEDAKAKRKHSYSVDEIFYAHLVLLPFALLHDLFGPSREVEEVNVYEKALINFLDGS